MVEKIHETTKTTIYNADNLAIVTTLAGENVPWGHRPRTATVWPRWPRYGPYGPHTAPYGPHTAPYGPHTAPYGPHTAPYGP